MFGTYLNILTLDIMLYVDFNNTIFIDSNDPMNTHCKSVGNTMMTINYYKGLRVFTGEG